MSETTRRPLLFPKFLLPSFPPPSPSSPPSRSSYLTGHTSYLACTTCAAHLCYTSQIISKGFTGRHGRAYLVSSEPSAPVSISRSSSSEPTTSLPNTTLQQPVPRQLVTGAHTVCDVSCVCGTVLGWKYVGAEEEAQRYKVGKFILETKKITASSCWEGPGSGEECLSEEGGEGDVEFDSQDEDECEDLFAGIWSPGLARRRRSRKIGRPASALFGM